MWPLPRIAPLAAKHIRILMNLALLVPIFWLLRSMTGLSYQRIALIFALSVPLDRNLRVRAVSCVSTSASRGAVLAHLHENYVWASALIAIAQPVRSSGLFFYLLSATQIVPRPGFRSNHRTRRRCRLCRGLWLERSSQLFARGSALGSSRRRPPTICDERFPLRIAALPVSL
jgi:hypothetical protein